QRIFWAFSVGGVAAVLLLGGGLEALQTASVASGLPFAVILIVMTHSLYKGVRIEFYQFVKIPESKEKEKYQDMVEDAMEDDKIHFSDQ
ncbi:MAG: BCCT family transporter, partial [Bacteroidota bacterium]